MFRLLMIIGAITMLNGCTSPKLEQYKDMTPQMDLKEYFNGEIKAWGIVQNWRGDVVNKFDVDMVGTWDGDVGTLKEQFEYYDKDKTQHRTWTIHKIDDVTFEGTADDILDKATGKVSGNAVNWAYRIDLPVDDKTYRITFDDWMWQMNDGILINRSYLKKFGITVAELTLFMQKQ